MCVESALLLTHSNCSAKASFEIRTILLELWELPNWCCRFLCILPFSREHKADVYYLCKIFVSTWKWNRNHFYVPYSFLCLVISQFCYDFRVFKFLNSDATGALLHQVMTRGLHPGWSGFHFFPWGMPLTSSAPHLLWVFARCFSSTRLSNYMAQLCVCVPSLSCGPGHVSSTSLYLILHLCNKQSGMVLHHRFCEDWMGY